MASLYILFAVVDLILVVVALIDCLSTEDHEVRGLPKVAWAFIILLFSPVGGIAWFVAGRPRRSAAADPAGWHTGGRRPEPLRPRRAIAPDDDPTFLSGLADKRDSDEELLRRWEADLRRREDELRRRRHPAGDEDRD
ncbi:MAG TPA: PLD nuclease N-terminal domain-containing protein [Catenuloplanes sp.]|jgi:hypothetical protein